MRVVMSSSFEIVACKNEDGGTHVMFLGMILSFCLMTPFKMPLIVLGPSIAARLLPGEDNDSLVTKYDKTAELTVLSTMKFSIFCTDSLR